jgi:hypothetical protein
MALISFFSGLLLSHFSLLTSFASFDVALFQLASPGLMLTMIRLIYIYPFLPAGQLIQRGCLLKVHPCQFF